MIESNISGDFMEKGGRLGAKSGRKSFSGNFLKRCNMFLNREKETHMNARNRSCLKFTLIELLVVIAILAILVSLLSTSLRTIQKKAYIIGCVNKGKTVAAASAGFAGDDDDNFPRRIQRLSDVSYYPLMLQYNYPGSIPSASHFSPLEMLRNYIVTSGSRPTLLEEALRCPDPPDEIFRGVPLVSYTGLPNSPHLYTSNYGRRGVIVDCGNSPGSGSYRKKNIKYTSILKPENSISYFESHPPYYSVSGSVSPNAIYSDNYSHTVAFGLGDHRWLTRSMTTSQVTFAKTFTPKDLYPHGLGMFTAMFVDGHVAQLFIYDTLNSSGAPNSGNWDCAPNN